MELNWKMPAGLKVHYRQELEKYSTEFANGKLQVAWRHLERAHILGQPWPCEHTHVHWVMMKFGIKIKNGREILGQIPRLLVGGVKSFVGNIPVGNTGGANVPPLQPMEIPDDLKSILQQFKS
jgi:hypothetical protein